MTQQTNKTYINDRVQDPNVVRLCVEKVHEVIVPHRLTLDWLVDRSVRRFGDDILLASLVFIRAGGAVEKTTRHGQ